MVVDVGLANAAMTGIVTGSVIALGAIGLALVYNIADVPNFAHGDILTFGAYAALLVNMPHTVPGLRALTTGPQSLTVAGRAVLFSLSLAGLLTIVYHLGGKAALRGEWWGPGTSRIVGIGIQGVAAILLAGAIAVSSPSFFAALLFAVVVSGALIPVMESRVFRKFRARGASIAMMLIVSLAVAFVLRFSIQTVFGGEVRFYDVDTDVGGFELTRALYHDLLVGTGGVGIDVQTTGAEAARFVSVSYSWLEALSIVVLAAAVGVLAYRYRGDAQAVVGPRLAAAAGTVAAVLVGGALLSGGTLPSDPLYGTRIRLSPLRASVVLVSLLMMGALHYVLRATILGKAMRATSDNRNLAMIRGINTRQVLLSVWIIAGVFGALGGVMLGFVFSRIGINLGFDLLIPMFAGVILGGISVYGAILGSYIVGLAMEVGIYAIPGLSATYRVPVAFVVLFVVLLVRPEGIIGGN
mgnify:FL=1